MTDNLPPGSIPGELDCLQLNRLRWQCRRGMLELDLVLERFLGENYAGLTVQQRQEFEALLELEDHELWQRVRGEAATASVVERLLRAVEASHDDSFASSRCLSEAEGREGAGEEKFFGEIHGRAA